MPFLLPALVALPSDAVILFLGLSLSPVSAIHDGSGDDDDVVNNSSNHGSAEEGGRHASSRHWVYRVYYLVCLSSIRMFLVLVPLLFHSYTGTALRFPALYQILYWGTLAVLVVHMLALSLHDPESLEAVIPLDSASSHGAQRPDAVHELRRIWYILLLSVVSDMCHLVILFHVRSTAPYHPLLTGKTKQPSIYFALRSQGGLTSSAPPTNENGAASGTSANGSHHEVVLINAMSEFVDELHIRLERTKADWGARLEDFTLRLSHSHDRPPVRSLHNPLAPLTPFRVLLQLFADENVVENGRLDAVFDADDGSAMTFFVPQLLSFLLHGALYKSQCLEEWILGQCRRNVHFAHRCYWFLRAWCLETPAEAVMMSRPSSDSHLSNRGTAPFLDEPASPQDSIPCHPRVVRRRSDRRRSLRGAGTGGNRSEERLMPEERAMIERLMLRVKECGEEAAVELAFGVADGDSTPQPDSAGETRTVNFDLAHRPLNSPSDLMDAVESGVVPVDPTTGYPSVKHLDSISARQRFGFLPVDNEALRLARSGAKPQRNGLRNTDEFDKTPQFLDALLCLADSLFHVPPKDRRAELRRQLRVLECDLLPSNSVYVPIGNVHHRVWRIVVDESVCIGTKERVPCIVCLEVVDYPFKKRRTRAWSFLDRLPRRGPASSSRESMESETPASVSPNRRVSNEGIELLDIRSEAETISEWRYSRRDPRRRSSIFDVVSSTVRESMKGPLDKMKTQMRNAYPDRPTDEELKSLTIMENLARDDHPSPDVLLGKSITCDEADSSTDVTASESPQESMIAIKDSREPSSLSRVNSAASLASMGQWTSPTPAGRILVQPKHGLDMDESGGVALLYGSDQEEELSRRKGSVQKVSSSIRPPVVFRESWQSKQDRLRSRSAYGHHPGWKLVPLLIKANDDLRQEQLASQLIYRMAAILSREKVPVWLCPYEIIALTESGGVVEAIPDTISLDSLKRNDPNYHGLKHFFLTHFGEGTEEFADAQANFVESLAAYSIVCFLLQLKDRHNGNILLDNRGHIIHIDFGFFFLSSPGKNAGFESAPFKLTRDFVEMLGGPNGRMFRAFRELCVKTFITLRKHCMEIILLVEMLKTGNEELNCFRGRPDEAIRQLRDRFRLDLNDRACREYVNCLVDDSIENELPEHLEDCTGTTSYDSLYATFAAMVVIPIRRQLTFESTCWLAVNGIAFVLNVTSFLFTLKSKTMSKRPISSFFQPVKKLRASPSRGDQHASHEKKGTKEKYTLFCDLDGVLVDFDAGVRKIFGKPAQQVPPNRLWPAIHKSKHFFRDLPWMTDGEELWDALQKSPYSVNILTGVSMRGEIVQDKYEWCQRELCVETNLVDFTGVSGKKHEPAHPNVKRKTGVVNVITCWSKNKCFESKPGHVLIDDREKLKDDWEKAGGTFILHTSARSTLDALRELGILLLQEDKVGNGVSAKESTADNQCSISNADEAKS